MIIKSCNHAFASAREGCGELCEPHRSRIVLDRDRCGSFITAPYGLCDFGDDGRAYAMLGIKDEDLMVLHYSRVEAA